jgi:uncharacterized protein (TIGR02246 family)
MNEASEKSIRALYLSWVEAWNARNAESMRSIISSEINMIGFDGSQMNGRDDVITQITDIFKSFPTGEFTVVIEQVRFIDENNAVLRALAGIIPRGYKDINPSVNALQTMTAHQVNGQWLIEIFQNTPAAFHGRPELQQEVTRKLREGLNSSGTTH